MPKRKVSSRFCLLCGENRENVSPDVSFHKFPSDTKIKTKWMNICNLNEERDNVSNTFLCSLHFREEDYININAKKFGGILKLKSGAVPTISVPKPLEEPSKTVVTTEPSFISTTSSSLLKSQAPVAVTDMESKALFCVLDSQLSTADSHTESQASSCVLESRSSTSANVTLTKCQASMLEFQPSTSVMVTHTEGQDVFENIERTPPKRKTSSPDVSTPKRAKRQLKFAFEKIRQQKKKLRCVNQRNRRLVNRIKSLKDLIKHLRNNALISNEASLLMSELPDCMRDMFSQKKNRKYSPSLRTFALTLQFYSNRAYNYVRKIWKNWLPHPTTLRKWYRVVDGKPGFTQESFKIIEIRNAVKPILCNIVLDEMSIRKQIIYRGGSFYGHVNIGTNIQEDQDNLPEAKNVLVFMAVALNEAWKIPLGYFLIDGLNGDERANLLKICFEMINVTGAKVYSITFDGAPVNFSMCTTLGANFNYYSSEFQPWFINHVTLEKVFIFWDYCHMIKLVRNTLGDKKILFVDNKQINWSHIKELHQLQYDEGLHAATKLTKKHIDFNDNRMNVKLATQTLSLSVSNALIFCCHLNMPKFKECMSTANFCRVFNNIFDILNCKNKFSKNEWRRPLCADTYDKLKLEAENYINYIEKICDNLGNPILRTQRKTGFLGLIICLKNIFNLYDQAVAKGYLDYLLSFKLSQDFLETFFSAIRSRGGFNNNPNAVQFESAYKRLLVKHEIMSEKGNCVPDGIDILCNSAKRAALTDPVFDYDEIILGNAKDHDYIATIWTLTPFVDNIVAYIAGFIVKKLLNRGICNICQKQIVKSEGEMPLLIKIKNRGALIPASDDVTNICRYTETTIREHFSKIFNTQNIKDILIRNVFEKIGHKVFDNTEMWNHLLEQDPIDNHRYQLIKIIIEIYINIRFYHEANVKSQKDEYIRNKYNKLVLFKNQ